MENLPFGLKHQILQYRRFIVYPTDITLLHYYNEDLSYLAIKNDDAIRLENLLCYAKSKDHTLVTEAAWCGSLQCLKLLIASNYPKNISAVTMTVSHNQPHALKILLDANYIVPEEVISKATMNGQTECLQLLLNFGNRRNHLPVYWAAAKQHFDCLQLLVNAGYVIHSSALSAAASLGNILYLRYLVDHLPLMAGGTKPYINSSITQCAAINGHVECFTYLLSVEWRFELQTLHTVIAGGQHQCLKVLIDGNYPRDIQATFHAANYNCYECLELLLIANYEIHPQALAAAISKRHHRCVELLKQYVN